MTPATCPERRAENQNPASVRVCVHADILATAHPGVFEGEATHTGTDSTLSPGASTYIQPRLVKPGPRGEDGLEPTEMLPH